jgi:cell division protein FtsB
VGVEPAVDGDGAAVQKLERAEPDSRAGLKEARRRDSRAKRARVLEAIRSLQQSGEKITHAAVARTAGVSSWLTYADGVREHLEAAISGQVAPRPSKRDNPASTISLRVDLEVAREEIRKLRTERDQLQRNARLHLGQQLDQIGAADLTSRVHELNQSKAELEALLGVKTAEADGLARRVTELEDELTAARTSLRQMIKNQSKGVASST